MPREPQTQREHSEDIREWVSRQDPDTDIPLGQTGSWLTSGDSHQPRSSLLRTTWQTSATRVKEIPGPHRLHLSSPGPSVAACCEGVRQGPGSPNSCLSYQNPYEHSQGPQAVLGSGSESKGSSGIMGTRQGQVGTSTGKQGHTPGISSLLRGLGSERLSFEERVPNRLLKAAQPLVCQTTRRVVAQDTVTLEGHSARGKLGS